MINLKATVRVKTKSGLYPVFSESLSRVGRVPFGFQTRCPASGKPQIFFRTPVPHRETVFWFSSAPSRIGKPTFHFRLAFSCVGTALSDFRWPFPASGQPSQISDDAVPRQEHRSGGGRPPFSSLCWWILMLIVSESDHKFTKKSHTAYHPSAILW